ncbi:Do family serine endopeptidase [Brevundimonas sp. S30B]|uniref:Do family serine endopeptidase n=1 Tax=unclassified Brevundimonas TaxID=2622653 RepID=UPI001072EB6C|nr:MULTISPECIES: Do family serine endopeptidase [unclassified Brevundimonas]QBX37112.1 Do family serine endopeptidase [Brevundimonas sp. MF30-B]TFW04633.1 Do family serine endopeptidase [Brevundimonas sp. S30B]
MLKRKEFILGAAAGLALAAGATAGGVITWPGAHAEPVAGASGRLTASPAPAAAFAPPQGAPLSFADIFQQVSPAVVSIDVTTRVQRPTGGFLQIPGLPPLPFSAPGQGRGQEGQSEEDAPTAQGAGSGFFISADGYIVTNNHVVEDATEIKVRLADQRELTARVVGTDPATDLAVIKVEGADFPFVSFEDQAQPRVGDWVIAIGNPLGLGGTATAGIVSALSRQNIDPGSAGYVDFLQIDAAINRGNSGGPTFDIYGRVIGVNSAIYSQTGGSIGIGFAIPASVAKPITDQLMRDGRVERGYVGLGLHTFDGDRWEALGQARDLKAAYVSSVTEGGPAARAGARVGDILVAVNGQAVANGTEATRLVGASRPGETIRLDIIRDGRRQTLNVRSGTRPSEAELLAADGADGEPSRPGQAPTPQGEVIEGVRVTAITPALRQRYGVAESVSGVVVTDVERGTAAARLGLRAGDVITRADTREVRSAADLQAAVAAVKQAGRPGVLIFVRRGAGQPAPIVLRFAEE